ncbi:MAG TPA: NAD-dependent epimerase/dehydratase family protein [Actinomycetes bacterium]
MRYFVTGATGFVGGRVVRQLVAAGHEVAAVVRDPARAGELAGLGVALHRGDVTDQESMRAPMAGADGVFHIAGWYKLGQRHARDGLRVNVAGTYNTLRLMRELGIPKGVYTSTLAVFSDTHGRLVDETYRYDGPHLSEYDRTKWIAHYEVTDPLIAAGLPLVIVQPGVIYGPGDTSSLRPALVQYLRRRLPLVPRGTAYCWAHVEDIARGHLLAMERGRTGESYIIAGPPHTFAGALELAEELTGIPAPRLRAAPGLLRAAAQVMGLVERVAPVPLNYSAEYLRVNAGVTYLGSNAKARRELGYDPRSLRLGLAETLAHELRLLGMDVPGRLRAIAAASS